MRRLALASLQFRAAASLATFVAVLVGGALLVACGGLFESAIRLDAPPQRLSGAPIVVTGPAGFKLPDQESETVAYPERPRVGPEAATAIAAVAGVDRVVPDVSVPAVVVSDRPSDDTAHVVSGHDWASAVLTPYTLRDGTAPTGRGQVVVDAGTANRVGAEPGDPLTLMVAGRPETFTVAGVAAPGRQVDASAVFFSTSDVRRLVPRTGTVDALGVLPDRGVRVDDLARRLSAALPANLTVRTGDDRGAAEFAGVEGSRLPLILLASIFGGMVAVVMALVVSATISLSVRQRGRELALLRAAGATPRQVYRTVVIETMVVAVLATVGGCALGKLAGEWIFSLSTSQGLVPETLEFRLGIVPFAAGAVVSLVSARVASGVAALPAARAMPIQALAEATLPPVDVGPVRRLLAAVFAVGTAGLAVTTVFLGPELAAAVGGPAVLTGAVAVALFGPELIDLLVGRCSAALHRITGRSGILATRNLRARGVQFAAVLTPLTLGVSIALGNIYSQTTLDEAATRASAAQVQADAVVTSAGGIGPDLLERVRRTSGVAEVSALVSSHGWIEEPYDSKGSDPSTLLGVQAPDRASILAVPVVAGSLRQLTGQTVAVPQREARDLGIGLGDRLTMRLGDGARVRTKVVALLDSGRHYASVVLPADLLAAHTTAGIPTQVLVRAEPREDRDAVIDAIRTRLVDWPGTSVGDQDLVESTFAAGSGVQAWINYLIAGLAIAYAAVASVNTLAVAVLSRRQEFALQRLAGATRRQVRRMLLVEGGVMAAAGIAVGTAVAAFTVVPTALASGSILPTGPVWVCLAVIGAVFLIVWPVTAVAAHAAMRGRPVDVLASPAG